MFFKSYALVCAMGCLAMVARNVAWAAEENWALPKPMASWSEETKEKQRIAARELASALREAVRKGGASFTIAPGHYRFDREDLKNLDLWRAENMTINAEGATFWFHGRLRADSLRFIECRGVTLRGLTIDYDPICFSQGEVVAVDEKTRSVDIRIDPGFPLPTREWLGDDHMIKAVFFDPEGRMRSMRMDWIAEVEHLGERLFRAELRHATIFYDKSNIRPGDRLALPDRSLRHAVHVLHSEKVSLEDVTIYATPHMALTESEGAGGHVYRRCKVLRRPGTRRVIACNADVFHSIKVTKGPLIENCEFSWACDDFINIHSFWSLVYNQRTPTTLVVGINYAQDIFEGTQLDFYDNETSKPLGSRRVVSVKPVTNENLIARVRAMSRELQERGQIVRDIERMLAFVVEVDKPIKVKKYDVIGSYERSGSGTIIRNNHFHDTLARGVLHQGVGSVIEDNRFDRCGMAGVLVMSDRYFWEGPPGRELIIRGNTFTDCGDMITHRHRINGGSGTVSVLTHGTRHDLVRGSIQSSGIAIKDNTFIRPAAQAVFMAGARDSVLEGNRIEGAVAQAPPFRAGPELPKTLYAIYLMDCENVAIANNTVTASSPHCLGDIGTGPNVINCTANGDKL